MREIPPLIRLILLLTAVLVIYRSAVAQDMDGDGVPDAQELLDGSDPADHGSNLPKRGEGTNGNPIPLCGEWNSFLQLNGRMWNILEHINASAAELGISTAQRSFEGAALRTLGFTIAAGAQRDLLVHDMGQRADSYGQVCSLASLPALDATMVHYKPAPSAGTREFQFAIAMQLGSEKLGEQVVPLNTYDIDNLARGVANWITVANAEASPQSGTLIFHEMDGGQIGSLRVTLAAGQRRDYSGHEVGPNRVGIARFVPDSASARFRVRSSRYLYDNAAWTDSFSSAVAIDGLSGSGRTLVAPLDTRGQWAIVEIANATPSDQTVSGDVLSEQGDIKHAFRYILPAHGSVHLITNAFLPEQRGLVRLRGTERESIVAVAMHYRRGAADGLLQYLYATPALEALGSTLFASFNSYLGQQPRAVLLNATKQPQPASYSLIRNDGAAIVLNQRVTIPASGALTVDLAAITEPDIYGVLSIVPDRKNTIVAWVERVKPNEFVLTTQARQAPLSQPPSGGQERMVLQSFDGPLVPLNKDGDGYPNNYDNGNIDTGLFAAGIYSADAITGNSLRMQLTERALYAQFNPYGYNTGVRREFARDYCANPAGWKFNTYNRMRFWLKRPVVAVPHVSDGTSNMNVGTYVKRVDNPDSSSDEEGGGHFYHKLNVPATGIWTQVVLNMHPDHERGNPGGLELPNLLHPTGESAYNYYDAFTRFYIQDDAPPSGHPADYLLDDIEFYRELNVENDDQIRNISATYVPSANRVILTWFRNKDENAVNHEVRFSFSSIHQIGWQNAAPAPGGVIAPQGFQGYNGMTYETTSLPLAGRTSVYLAIKPVNSALFTQVLVRLNLD